MSSRQSTSILTRPSPATGEIDVILSNSADPDDEIILSLPAVRKTKPGAIWILGKHRVAAGTAAMPLSSNGSSARAPDRFGVPGSSLQRQDRGQRKSNGASR